MSTEEREERIRIGRPRSTNSVSGGTKSLPTPDRPVRELVGSFDLVFPVHVIDDHVGGNDNDWLKAASFPRQLRPGGWVYLKVGDRVCARGKAVRLEYRDGLRYHTPNETGIRAELGGSAVIVIDPTSWTRCDFPADERHLQGYRYIVTDEERGVVSHLVGGALTDTYSLALE